MFPQIESLIRGVDDQRVLIQAGFFKVVQDPANRSVNTGHTTQVIFDVGLVLPVFQGFTLEGIMGGPKLSFIAIGKPAHRVPSRQTKRRFLLHIPAVQVIFDFHHVLGCGWPPRIVIVEVFRQGEIEIRKKVMVHGIRTPVPVRGLELVEQHEGLFRITLGQPVDAVVLNDLRGVARALDHCVLTVDAKLWIEVRPLSSPID